MGRFTIKSTKGFSLIELVMSVGILSIAIFAVGWTFLNISQSKMRQNFLSAVIENRRVFQNLVSNDMAWQFTALNNASMAGLLTGAVSWSGVSALPPQTFKLYDQNGLLAFDGTNPDAGFTVEGNACFFSTDPNCVLHVALTWLPQCDPASTIDPNCYAPYVQVQGLYSYTGKSLGLMNLANLSFLYGRTIARAPSSAAPCPNPPVGVCNLPNRWICMAPSSWVCHYFL